LKKIKIMNLKSFQKKCKNAFTLLELLLAVFILEIGLLGIAGFYTYSFQITKSARNQTIAANLAQGLLEEQLSKSYDAPDLISVSKTAYSITPDPFSNFQKQIDISCVDDSLTTINCDANAHMKKIVVAVYWMQETVEKNFQIATIKTEY